MSSDVAAFLRPVLKRAQAGEHVEYERIGQNANGQRRWMHGRMAPGFDGQGTRALLHRVRHPRPQADGAGARGGSQLRLFTDNIPEPVVYLDAERRYVFVNEAFLDLYGLSATRSSARSPRKCSVSKARRT